MNDMKLLKFKDIDGCRYVYNDDTGMIFDDCDINVEYMSSYYNKLINDINSMRCDIKSYDRIDNYYLENGFQQLTLQVTDQCNLRCKYCIYSDYYPESASYGDNFMKFETALKGIDIYMSYFEKIFEINSKRSPIFAFYGGEPLINFSVIRKSVEYIQREYPQYDHKFTITTNGILLADKDICDFLRKNNFWICVSIDGYKEHHDKNRLSIDGEKTYEKIIKNIDANLSDYENVFSLCCIDYSSDLLKLDEFYEKNDRRNGGKFPPLLRISLINSSFTTYYDNFSQQEINSYLAKYEMLHKIFLEKVLKNDKVSLFSDVLFSSDYLRFYDRQKFLNVCNFYEHGCGNCLPGDKLYVTTDGRISICEKVLSSNFSFGNVETGLDLNKVNEIIAKYNQKVISKCKDCIISRLCSQCYSTLDADFNIENNNICQNRIAHAKKILCNMVQIQKTNPDYLRNKFCNSLDKKADKNTNECPYEINKIFN